MTMQPFSAQDVAGQRRIGSVHAACGHDLAVFAVESMDLPADRCRSAVWYVRLAGGEPRPLTSGCAVDAEPRVSPDGKQVAFLSDRAGGAPQVHVIPTGGGEARRLGDFERGVLFLEWCPDGRRLLVAAAVAVDPEQRGARAGPAPARSASAPELVWRLPCQRDGEPYLLDREIHLFTLDLARGDCRRLTDGPFDVGSACWSPDGQHIAYTRSGEGRLAQRSELWIAAADGSAARRASEDVAGAALPAWSPDGRWIAFTGPRQEGEPVRLWLHDVERAAVLPLGDEDLEFAAGQRPQWQEDSETVVAVLAVRGLQQIITLAVPDGQRRVLVDGERQVADVALAKGYLVYTSESASTPCELFASDLDGRYEVPLTDLNAWWHERTALQVERRRFTVPDGDGGIETIDGWVLRPAGCGREATPWLVDVHDGPAGGMPLAYAAHPHWPLLASRGWSVLALDAAGSGSYGREFSGRLRGRWGELDLPQHLAALEQLRGEGLADERVAIAGTGYGGYLAARAIGRSSRFRAAVLAAPLLDAGSGRPITPLHDVAAMRTPTLILQGREDRRCPAAQAEALFAALLHSGRADCEMVLYPGAGHALFERGRPSHRIDAVQRLVDWLERWIDLPRSEAEVPAEAADAAAPGGVVEAAPRRRRSRARGEPVAST